MRETFETQFGTSVTANPGTKAGRRKILFAAVAPLSGSSGTLDAEREFFAQAPAFAGQVRRKGMVAAISGRIRLRAMHVVVLATAYCADRAIDWIARTDALIAFTAGARGDFERGEALLGDALLTSDRSAGAGHAWIAGHEAAAFANKRAKRWVNAARACARVSELVARPALARQAMAV
jgi:hypothetical protein